jgi:hypothetical protein
MRNCDYIVFTDLDDFLDSYDKSLKHCSFSREQIGDTLKLNGNLIFMPSLYENGINHYCSYVRNRCESCEDFIGCTKAYNLALREMKLKRILNEDN